MQDRSALRPSVAVGEALRGVARDILTEARAAIEDPAKSDAERVHDFRRTMKRWRGLLRLLEPFVGQEAKRLRDEARDLARMLSGARDGQSRSMRLPISKSMVLPYPRARSPDCANGSKPSSRRRRRRSMPTCACASAVRSTKPPPPSSAGRCTS